VKDPEGLGRSKLDLGYRGFVIALERHPEMEPVLHFVDTSDYDGGITRAEQEARTARKSLASGIFDDMD